MNALLRDAMIPAGLEARRPDAGARLAEVRGGPHHVPMGEIALLNDSPRTATVAAAEESDLYALERDEFLPAVTGSPRTRDAADGVVAKRVAAYERATAG